MADPRLERPDPADPARLYLVDGDGRRWRVHDCTYRGGRWHRHRLGDRNAATRVFVPEDRSAMLRLYHLADHRELEPATLARQLATAGYADRRPLARPHVDGPR